MSNGAKIGIVLLSLLIVVLLYWAWYEYEKNNNSLGLSQVLAANLRAGGVVAPLPNTPQAQAAPGAVFYKRTAIAPGSIAAVSGNSLSVSKATVNLANEAGKTAIQQVVNAAANASPDDVVNGCNILLQNISTSNLNYAPLSNILGQMSVSVNISGVNKISAGPGYDTNTANSLWVSLNNIYWPNINGSINQLQLLAAKKTFATQAAALLNSSLSSYNFTNFATSLVKFNNAILQELTNETITQIDALIYAPYSGYDTWLAKHNIQQTSGLISTWELTKWQLSNDNNLAPVFYSLKTNNVNAHGSVFHTNPNGDRAGQLYFNNGSNYTSLTNTEGNNVYKCNRFDLQSIAISNFISNYQAAAQYKASQAAQSNLTQAMPFIQFSQKGLLTFVGLLLA